MDKEIIRIKKYRIMIYEKELKKINFIRPPKKIRTKTNRNNIKYFISQHNFAVNNFNKCNKKTVRHIFTKNDKTKIKTPWIAGEK